jgi:hypothetical protein
MLYVFAGYPQCGLNAGGLQHAVEEVETLALLEHDPAIQYAREGVYALGEGRELLRPIEYEISPSLTAIGLTWDWFPENWSFGNGVTVHKTTAMRDSMLIDHGRNVSIADLLATGRPVDLWQLTVRQVPKRTEGWEQYEARWRPGTCPQESHIVHLTWLVTKHRIPGFAYARIRALVEDHEVVLKDRARYEPKHFSPERRWDGEQPRMPAGAFA